MRRTVTIALSNGAAIINEIRPIDVANAITSVVISKTDLNESIENEAWSAALFSSDLLSAPELLSEADSALINTAFIKLNAAYIGNGRVSKTQSQKITTVRDLARMEQSLNSQCAVLIHHGHLECWTYGWSFFLAAQDLYRDK